MKAKRKKALARSLLKRGKSASERYYESMLAQGCMITNPKFSFLDPTVDRHLRVMRIGEPDIQGPISAPVQVGGPRARLYNLIALGGRKSASSSELFLQLESELSEFFTEIWAGNILIGYGRLARIHGADEFRAGRHVATFELAELLSANSPCPGPLISLSAVLWSRQELHAELSEFRSSDLQEDSTPEPSAQPADGVSPREV